MRPLFFSIRIIFEIVSLPVLILMSFFLSYIPKKVDIGLGPFPLINNIYHKRALVLAGYSVETFVIKVWYITSDFDIRLDQRWFAHNWFARKFLFDFYVFLWSAARYRSLMVYFDGGPFGLSTLLLWRVEPFLYRLAGVRTVVLPYGSDVQVMSRSPNLLFKHAMAQDYPQHRTRHSHIQRMIDTWTANADHIVAGCEWVDYMHHWDTLMLAHFSIEMPNQSARPPDVDSCKRLKLLHAPNHREIKGTSHIVRAVEELRAEGLNIELVVVERVSNEEVRRLILEADVVIDQLIVGWYAMFAIEAMASGKPVVCYLRRDLEELYVAAGLLRDFNEIPIIRSTVFSIKDVIRDIYDNRSKLLSTGGKGRGYVERHHSVQAISCVFSKIFTELIGTPKDRAKAGLQDYR